MKKGYLMLLALLMLCMGVAAADLPEQLVEIGPGAFEGDAALTGVMHLPDMVETVGARAFAGTSLHALIVPEGCSQLSADVLAETEAAYVTLHGAATTVTAQALTDVPFLFAPEGSAASGVAGFYASETLVVIDGFYFTLTAEEATPLCAAFPQEEEIRLPKVVEELPVISLDALSLRGCADGMVAVPSWMTIPDGLNVTTYDAMTLTAPVPSVIECTQGDEVTWTTEIAGAYGDVSYVWHFNTDGVISSKITAVPEVTWGTTTQGLCIASVMAIDALGDEASAKATTGVTVGEPIPIYRALLIGNTYPDDEKPLHGCDTDAYAMRTMLNSMPAMDYDVTLRLNVTASEIQSAIATTYAGARDCDVSLFYFSGHGSSSGSLVGIGNSSVSVGALRSWLDAVPGMKIVIIDCCYSGRMIGKSVGSTDPSAFTSAFISGFSSYTKANNLANNGYVVMTACTMDQYSESLSDGTISFGAFTYGVCYGSGYDEWNQVALGYLPADTDGNGQITLGEAYAETVEQVAWLASMVSGMDQSAQYYGDTAFVLWGK